MAQAVSGSEKKCELELELARNFLISLSSSLSLLEIPKKVQARAWACLKFFKKFELELEPEARQQKLELSSKLELLGTLWQKGFYKKDNTFVQCWKVLNFKSAQTTPVINFYWFFSCFRLGEGLWPFLWGGRVYRAARACSKAQDFGAELQAQAQARTS